MIINNGENGYHLLAFFGCSRYNRETLDLKEKFPYAV